MTTSNIIFTLIGTLVTSYIQLIASRRLSNNKIKKLPLSKLSIVFISGLIITYNIFTNQGIFRATTSFFILLIAYLFVYEEPFINSFAYLLISYAFSTLFEILYSIILLSTNIVSIETFDSSNILKLLFSLSTIFTTFLVCKNKKLKSFANTLVNKINKRKEVSYILISSLLLFLLIDYKFISNINPTTYIINIILISIVILLIFVALLNAIKLGIESERNEHLLNHLTKYEKMVDKDRANRHEQLNNLLVLKNIEDKNSKEYNDFLEELIQNHTSESKTYKNVHKLPTGLKGMIYDKLFDLDPKLKINIHISNKTKINLDKKHKKEFIFLCKLVGIVLDNAIEASSKSKDKIINFDINGNNNKTYIIVDNSFKKKVNLKRLNQKDFSTNGKGRGLGLFLANKLLKDSEYIEMKQEINDKLFTTTITIKN